MAIPMTSRAGDDLEPVTRAEVEDLLYLEADLIDRWDLDAWVALYTPDAYYSVPTTDAPDGDPEVDLVFINHDYTRIKALAKRLLGSKAYREYPFSNVQHVVGNVRVLGVEPDGLHATAAFVVWRFRGEDDDHYVGRYDYWLVRRDGELRIRRKRCTLAHTSLRPAGAISIVL